MSTNDQQRAAQRAYDNQAPDDDDGPRRPAPRAWSAPYADEAREWAGIEGRRAHVPCSIYDDEEGGQ